MGVSHPNPRRTPLRVTYFQAEPVYRAGPPYEAVTGRPSQTHTGLVVLNLRFEGREADVVALLRVLGALTGKALLGE